MGGLANPKNMEKGRGFFDGLEAVVTDAGWAEYDADGKWANPSTCFYLELSSEKLNDPITQYWSIGSPADFQPTKDGNGVVAKKAMNERCNLAFLMKSLANAGVPEEILDGIDDDAGVIVGYTFRFTTTFKNKGDKYGTPTVDEILDGPAAPKNIAGEAEAVVRSILIDKAGSVALRSLPKLIGTKTDDKDVRKTIMSKGFLEGLDGISIDGNNLVAA